MGSAPLDLIDRAAGWEFGWRMPLTCVDNEPRSERAGRACFRRVAGPHAEESLLVARPEPCGSVVEQAESAYTALLEAMEAEGITPASIASETLFVGSPTVHVRPILEARRGLLAGLARERPPTACVRQAPLRKGAVLEVAVRSLVARRSPSWPAAEISVDSGCACAECGRLRARVVRLGAQTHLHAGDIVGSGGDAYEQACAMFVEAERLLEQAGMDFGDVVRTWIYLRHMERDYEAFNRARRAFFAGRGIERKPASTAVGGAPCARDHDFSLGLHAIRSTAPLAVQVMSSPTLNEAWDYGSDFSRGLKVEEAHRTALYISGTASVDECGRTAHAGDPAAQAERMLANIEALLAAQGASVADLVSAVVYVKRPQDAEILRAVLDRHGFRGFPCVWVQTPICRPELLCETEAVAALPAGLPAGRDGGRP